MIRIYVLMFLLLPGVAENTSSPTSPFKQIYFSQLSCDPLLFDGSVTFTMNWEALNGTIGAGDKFEVFTACDDLQVKLVGSLPLTPQILETDTITIPIKEFSPISQILVRWTNGGTADSELFTVPPPCESEMHSIHFTGFLIAIAFAFLFVLSHTWRPSNPDFPTTGFVTDRQVMRQIQFVALVWHQEYTLPVHMRVLSRSLQISLLLPEAPFAFDLNGCFANRTFATHPNAALISPMGHVANTALTIVLALSIMAVAKGMFLLRAHFRPGLALPPLSPATSTTNASNGSPSGCSSSWLLSVFMVVAPGLVLACVRLAVSGPSLAYHVVGGVLAVPVLVLLLALLLSCLCALVNVQALRQLLRRTNPNHRTYQDLVVLPAGLRFHLAVSEVLGPRSLYESSRVHVRSMLQLDTLIWLTMCVTVVACRSHALLQSLLLLGLQLAAMPLVEWSWSVKCVVWFVTQFVNTATLLMSVMIAGALLDPYSPHFGLTLTCLNIGVLIVLLILVCVPHEPQRKFARSVDRLKMRIRHTTQPTPLSFMPDDDLVLTPEHRPLSVKFDQSFNVSVAPRPSQPPRDSDAELEAPCFATYAGLDMRGLTRTQRPPERAIPRRNVPAVKSLQSLELEGIPMSPPPPPPPPPSSSLAPAWSLVPATPMLRRSLTALSNYSLPSVVSSDSLKAPSSLHATPSDLSMRGIKGRSMEATRLSRWLHPSSSLFEVPESTPKNNKDNNNTPTATQGNDRAAGADNDDNENGGCGEHEREGSVEVLDAEARDAPLIHYRLGPGGRLTPNLRHRSSVLSLPDADCPIVPVLVRARSYDNPLGHTVRAVARKSSRSSVLSGSSRNKAPSTSSLAPPPRPKGRSSSPQPMESDL